MHLLARTKIGDRYSDDRNEQDYMKGTSLRDTQIWFRMRSRMTLRIKANRSSMFRGDMGCRYCNTDLNEYKEHQEICPGLAQEQRGLNLNEEQGKYNCSKL